MEISEMAKIFNLPKEQVERIKAIFQKIEKDPTGWYCDSCSGEWYTAQLVKNMCPMCLTEGSLEEIIPEDKEQ